MNSPDPWRSMQSSPPFARSLTPSGRQRHPFYGYGYPQGWASDQSSDWEPGQLRGEVFVGAAAPTLPGDQRQGLTAVLAPVVAPTSGGFTAHVDLDDHQILHAAVCVDGKCYRSSMNLAPAISAIMARFAQYHADLHRSMPGTTVSGDVALGAVDRAVGAAGDALVGALLEDHVRVACGGFLDDIGNALKGAGSAVAEGVSATFQKLKGPIATAATAAAAAGAMAIPGVGPLAAPLAGKLAGDLVNSTLGDSGAKKAVAQAAQQAKTDPTVAAALDQAKQAVAHSTVAHHVAETAQQAAAGHPVAQQQIHEVVQAVEQGDPAAHAVAPAIVHGFGAHMRKHGGRHALPHYRQKAAQAVAQAAQEQPAPAYGYIRTGHQHQVIPFNSTAEAAAWRLSLPAYQYTYAAAFDGGNLGAPVDDGLGTARA